MYLKQFFASFQPTGFTAQEVDSVLNAYSEVYSYCQENFRKYRWNCPMPSRISDANYPISLTALYPLGKFIFVLKEPGSEAVIQRCFVKKVLNLRLGSMGLFNIRTES